jgi:GPI inositol-deacylase
MLFIFALVFLVIPWQVAFLGCWLIQLSTCASPDIGSFAEEDSEPTGLPQKRSRASENDKINMYLLLLMTWLLPLAAPVLVVWIRTLAQVGLTTPFDGDHFVLSVAPFLILVDYASWSAKPIFERVDMCGFRTFFIIDQVC